METKDSILNLVQSFPTSPDDVVEIGCLEPVLIINPSAREIALQSDAYYIDGVRHTIDSELHWKILQENDKISKILGLPFVESLSEDFRKKHSTKEVKECEERLSRFLADSFFLLEDGECKPIWIYVPCGHCDVCLNRKLTSILQRAQFAQLESQRPFVYCTLTYNDSHLPSDGVSLRDVQLFKKKLKRAVSSLFGDVKAKDIKFLITSEYGDLGRPHYHCLIFGIPEYSKSYVQQDYFVRYLVCYAWRDAVIVCDSPRRYESFDNYRISYWQLFNRPDDYDPYSKGFCNVVLIDGSSKSVVSYVTKYIFKDAVSYDEDPNFDDHFDVSYSVDDGFSEVFPCNPTFISVSHNLGVKFVRDNFDYREPKFKYRSIDGFVEECNLSSYYLKKLLPSPCEIVPSSIRQDFYDLVKYGNVIMNSNYPNYYKSNCVILLDKIASFRFPLSLFDGKYQRLAKCCDMEFALDDRKGCVEVLFHLEYIDLFVGCFNRLYEFLVDFDYDLYLEKCKQRQFYFSRMKPRTRGQLLDTAVKFRRNLIKNLSNRKI